MAYPATFPLITYSAISGSELSLITEVRRLLAEPIARDFTDAQIQYWCDRGASIAARKAKSGETCQVFKALSTSTNIYTVETALFDAPGQLFIEIDSVFFHGQTAEGAPPQLTAPVLGYPLIRINKRQFSHLKQNTEGAPKYWCVTRDSNILPRISIWPAPSVTYNGMMIEYFFYRVANTYKAADTVPSTDVQYLPEWLRDLPVWYAVSEAYRSIGRISQAEQYYAYFNNIVMFHRQDRYDRIHEVDSSDMMDLPDYTQVTS